MRGDNPEPGDGAGHQGPGEEPGGSKASTTLLDQLAALDMGERRELATMLRSLVKLAEEYRDGRPTAHTCGVLANLLDPP
jgi:hypothetical protein